MKAAFIDTSAVASVLFRESTSRAILETLRPLEKAYASFLLEAELRCAAAREGTEQDLVDQLLGTLALFQPDRPLTHELKTVLASGPILRGADLWHVACALHVAGDPSNFPFITLDRSQALAASRLGFKVLPEFPSGSAAHEAPTPYRTHPKKASRVKGRKPLRRKMG